MNNKPAYILLDECYSLGENAFVYPHLPITKMTETRLTVTTMTDTVMSTGDWTFLVCATKEKEITCTNLDKETLNDTNTSFIMTPGCWMVHNCSVLHVDNTTYATKISIQYSHLYQMPTIFLENLEKEHYEKFVQATQKLQEISEFNEKQLSSIDKHIKKTQASLRRSMIETHNLVGLIRTNTYIHKDWNQKMQHCSFWDYIARLVQLDFICTPIYNWWHWLKEAMWITVMIGIAYTVFKIVMCFRNRNNYAKKKWEFVGTKV